MKNNVSKLIRFVYNNRYYQSFISKDGKLSFLEIDKDDKYHYPKYEELLAILDIFFEGNGVLAIKNSKKFSFIPKFFFKGALITMTAASLTACAKNASSVETPVSIVSEEEEKIKEEEAASKIDQKYREYLELADDDIDWKYANDYEHFESVSIINVKDASSYETIYGYSNVSLDSIKEVIYNNSEMSDFFKDFTYNWAVEWMQNHPGSDLSTFYHNVQNMPIYEVDDKKMLEITLSASSEACYVPEENALYVLKGTDFSRNSNGFIVLSHELTHPARSANFLNDKGEKVTVRFYNSKYMGGFADEALITNFAYDAQGLGGRSNYYTLACSYYRVILDCIDYTGTDYMNHSVNYLIDKMDKYMGTDEAYHIISLIDCESALKYNKFLTLDFKDFDETYNYITRMYMKKHLTADMSYDEARAQYDNLMSEITYFFDEMSEPYKINYDEFERTFEECVKEAGISKGYTR